MTVTQTFRAAVFASGLLLGSAGLPLWAVDEVPHQTPASTPEAKPESAQRGAAAYLERFKSATDSLKLTDEQKPKLDTLFDAARKEIDGLDDKADPNERATKVGEIFAKLRKEVGAVLTNPQKLEIQKKLAPPGPGVMIDKIKQQLNKPEMKLTDEQKKKVDAVLDDTKQKLSDLRTEYPKGGPEVRDKVRTILSDMRLKLVGVLSPDQQEKLKSPTADPSSAPSKEEPKPSKE